MRSVFSTLLAAGLASTCLVSVAQAADPVSLSFFVFAGNGYDTTPKAVIADYMAAHPDVKIDVVESTNSVEYPLMVAAHRTTPDQPLIHCGFFNRDSVFKGDVDGMWESLDPKAIPNMAHVLPGYERPDNMGVAYATQVYGLLYNTDHIKTPPESWTDLWNPKYKGHVAVFDYDMNTMALAAKLSGGDERNPDAGFKTLADNAQNFVALPNSNDGLKNLLSSGDAWIAPWVNSISDVWIKQGAPLAFAVPKEGVVPNPIYLTISAGVTPEQRAVCSDIINILLAPENEGKAAELTSSIPLTDNVKLSAEQLANPLMSPAIAANVFPLDAAYMGTVASTWRDRWDKEVKVNMN